MTTPKPWAHGYPTDTTYTCGFFRELAPGWLDFAALVKGIRPPRQGQGQPFRYLELGCGMGFSLALLAALHPEGEFLGIDFHPDHIAHGEDLHRRLELDNLRFLEADFLELQTNATALHHRDVAPSSWTYVAAHGIATWVDPEVQQALLSVASRSLAPGGLFYCSYNTLPGWLSGSVFHRLAQFERKRVDSSDPATAFSQASRTLRKLLGLAEQPSALARSLPSLVDHLRKVDAESTAYLAQEYVENWQPLYAAEMHHLCRQHKLTHVGTATLPELVEHLLPENLRDVVLAERNPALRETLLDLATNQSFRRDLFMRGRLRLTEKEREEALAGLKVRICEAPPTKVYTFTTSFGGVKGDTHPYRTLEAALTSGPRSLGELSTLCGRPLSEVLGMAILLLHSGRLALDRGDSAESANPICRRVAAALQDRILQGLPYDHLPAPAIGTAVSFSLVECLTARALVEGLEADILVSCVQMGLQQMKRRLNDGDGQPFDDDAKEFEALSTLIERLITQRLPAIRALGLFEQS